MSRWLISPARAVIGMNVAILHYHFNRGGVTQVVLNHLQALDVILPDDERIAVALIHGGRREGISDDQLSGFRALHVSTRSVASLDYDDRFEAEDEKLAGEIRDVLAEMGFLPDDTLLHAHNHSLGKNVSLPGAIRRLAEDGYRFVLQIHDFAEDLRPANYSRLSQSLGQAGDQPFSSVYPQASQIHYAVLNGRDYGVLERAGVPGVNLHRLPNAAGEFGELPAKDAARRKLEQRFGIPADSTYILYPVRGIRRKNLGEVLLWSATAPENCFVGITLAPQNPAERRLYTHWNQLARELDLPCVFETGGDGGLEFPENLAAADLLLTTSVAEGFGMVFLETWLAGRNLVGRDLPEITADFVHAGIHLETLYPQLSIPIEWVGKEALGKSLAQAFDNLRVGYGITSRAQASVQQQLASLLQAECIDFGMLDSSQQSAVIRKVREDGSLGERLLELNPRVCAALLGPVDESNIETNTEVVRQVYSLEASGRRLKQVYEQVMSSRTVTDIQPLARADEILNAFLDMTRLHPVRFEE